MNTTIEQFMDQVQAKNPGENEFHQAVHEVVESLWLFLKDIGLTSSNPAV